MAISNTYTENLYLRACESSSVHMFVDLWISNRLALNRYTQNKWQSFSIKTFFIIICLFLFHLFFVVLVCCCRSIETTNNNEMQKRVSFECVLCAIFAFVSNEIENSKVNVFFFFFFLFRHARLSVFAYDRGNTKWIIPHVQFQNFCVLFCFWITVHVRSQMMTGKWCRAHQKKTKKKTKQNRNDNYPHAEICLVTIKIFKKKKKKEKWKFASDQWTMSGNTPTLDFSFSIQFLLIKCIFYSLCNVDVSVGPVAFYHIF